MAYPNWAEELQKFDRITPDDDEYIVLRGQYNYIRSNLAGTGYTLDLHMRNFIKDYEIVSHSLHGQNDTKYTVIMKRRPE